MEEELKDEVRWRQGLEQQLTKLEMTLHEERDSRTQALKGGGTVTVTLGPAFFLGFVFIYFWIFASPSFFGVLKDFEHGVREV